MFDARMRRPEDGNGSGRGKLTLVPWCGQRPNAFSYRTVTSITRKAGTRFGPPSDFEDCSFLNTWTEPKIAQ